MIHNSHLKYRSDIDGLRAVAILLVIIFHAFPKFLRGGFIGVDIFFVISGYLITSIILKGLHQEKFSPLDFYSRRIKRIFPALTTVLVFCLVAGWFILLANEYQVLGKHVAAGATYISNFILESESGYFDTEAELKPLLHLWSLSIEEQFYLIFPLILMLTFRIRVNPAVVILSLLLASFAVNIVQINSNAAQTFYYPHTRVWELLIGSFVAYINLYKRSDFDRIGQRILLLRVFDKEQALANLLSWLGFLLIVVAWKWLDHEKISYPSGWALMPTLGAACLILAGEKAWLNRKFLSNKIVVFIGLISYPLYLWHWPLLSFTRIVEMEKPNSGIRFLVLVLSGLLAWLTYYFIEKKLRHREHWMVAVSLLACLGLIGVVGYQVKQQKGYVNRLYATSHLDEEIGVTPWLAKGWVKQPACLNKFGEFEFCLIQDIDRPATSMLIGDSHANHLYPGLIQHTAITGGNLLNLGMGGCLHFLNNHNKVILNEEKNCQPFVDKALKVAISNPLVKTVFLAGSWRGNLMERKRTLRKMIGQKSPDISSNFEESMMDTLEALIRAEKEIVFVMDVPGLGFRPNGCIERPWRVTGALVKTPCAVLRTKVDEDGKLYINLTSKVLRKYPQVKIWDPLDALCDDSYCWAVKDGKMLYRDEGHLSESGSLYIGKRFHLQPK